MAQKLENIYKPHGKPSKSTSHDQLIVSGKLFMIQASLELGRKQTVK